MELGSLAVECSAAKQRNISLANLVAVVLRKTLPKEANVRISPQWSASSLPQNFRDYAALDAFAVHEVYHCLKQWEKVQPIDSKTPGGTGVTLHAPDGQQVASGYIADDRPAELGGVKLTSTRVLITITAIDIPAYYHNPAPHSSQPKPLSEWGRLPFSLVAHSRQVKHVPDHSHQFRTASLDATETVPDTVPTTSSSSGVRDEASFTQLTEEDVAQFTPDPVVEIGLLDEVDMESGLSEPSDTITDQQLQGSESDADADAALRELLISLENPDLSGQDLVRSRVLGDIWHLQHQFPISKEHGLRRPFSRALSAALFIPDVDDKAAVDAALARLHLSYETQIRTRPHWVLARVRRYVPAPEILLPRVAAVIKVYGTRKDVKTGQPLFNRKAWDVARNVLENIRLGYFSDPPDVNLYFCMRRDKYGLNVYRCARGTNAVEGGVHQNLIRRFSSFNISPRHACNLLLDYSVTHNMRVSHSHEPATHIYH